MSLRARSPSSAHQPFGEVDALLADHRIGVERALHDPECVQRATADPQRVRGRQRGADQHLVRAAALQQRLGDPPGLVVVRGHGLVHGLVGQHLVAADGVLW